MTIITILILIYCLTRTWFWQGLGIAIYLALWLLGAAVVIGSILWAISLIT